MLNDPVITEWCLTPCGIEGESGWVSACQSRPHVCSTPFGIKGEGSNELYAPTRSALCSTTFSIEGRKQVLRIATIRACCTYRAQRLSASKGKQVAADAPLNRLAFGAQRLSASKGRADALRMRNDIAGHDLVLNAFRHRRGKRTTAARPLEGDPHLVLNAFRHRRGEQVVGNSVTCITHVVLNAFRHRRGKQLPMRPMPTDLFAVCSTPFGI